MFSFTIRVAITQRLYSLIDGDSGANLQKKSLTPSHYPKKFRLEAEYELGNDFVGVLRSGHK